MELKKSCLPFQRKRIFARFAQTPFKAENRAEQSSLKSNFKWYRNKLSVLSASHIMLRTMAHEMKGGRTNKIILLSGICSEKKAAKQ